MIWSSASAFGASVGCVLTEATVSAVSDEEFCPPRQAANEKSTVSDSTSAAPRLNRNIIIPHLIKNSLYCTISELICKVKHEEKRHAAKNSVP